jgi:hypothetical protein
MKGRAPVLILAALVGAGCTPRPKVSPAAPSPPPGLFTDAARARGMDFTETNGADGSFKMIETTPGGCAFVDVDGDSWLDIVLIQSGATPGTPLVTKRPTCKLYRNQGDGTFRDTTQDAGLAFDQGYAQGVTVGDYDNDGAPDLFITAYDGCFLLHNDGHGRFRDISAKAGVSEKGRHRWATSAAFGDYDGDGHLDLIVLHYVPWTPQTDKTCTDTRGRKAYCSPEVYRTEAPALYHNNGDGTFTDVTAPMGLAGVHGRGLAVLWTDLDDDGKPDLLIANDLQPNMALKNEGRRFREVGLTSGLAYGPDGETLSGMGLAAGDLDALGRECYAVTNFSGQPHTLYAPGSAPGLFEDVTYRSGIGQPSLPFLAFGIEFADLDRDGLKDIVIGNGHIDPNVADSTVGVTYKQPKLIFHNDGKLRFSRLTDGLGDAATPRVTRGLAVGDFDNDGRLDILANNHNDDAELLHNESRDTNHWAGFQLEGVSCNRDAAGATMTITAGGVRRFARCRLASSYASSSDKRLFFGLGTATAIKAIEVVWPDGKRQRVSGPLQADRYYWLRQGARPVPDPRLAKR